MKTIGPANCITTAAPVSARGNRCVQGTSPSTAVATIAGRAGDDDMIPVDRRRGSHGSDRPAYAQSSAPAAVSSPTSLSTETRIRTIHSVPPTPSVTALVRKEEHAVVMGIRSDLDLIGITTALAVRTAGGRIAIDSVGPGSPALQSSRQRAGQKQTEQNHCQAGQRRE